MRLNTKDFETIKTLATGAVGRVCLVRSKKTKQVYALKILKKQDLLTRQEAAFFMEERNALVFAQKSDWITTLYAAFQDEDNLYLLMEYVSGGSMRALLNNREDIMKEDEARFYIMEMILSVAELHSHSYIHRDIKPENYLVDSNGHIKLADFGSCVRVSETARVNSHETVGTPDYISPEILKANEGEADYGIEVDWWSIGIILYELLCDEVPFYSESLVGTYGKIMNHKKHFAFPEDVELSEDFRLGKSGVQEIKNHPWFKGIDWENIRNAKAPFVPQLSGPEDTRYFEDEDTEAKKFVKKALTKTKEFTVPWNYSWSSSGTFKNCSPTQFSDVNEWINSVIGR
ncbi:kinase-like domain-containing protein [Globomyces pollinis-pini]|nr:kinase-like domain-containing protein [Globomyces pollinis-pini]